MKNYPHLLDILPIYSSSFCLSEEEEDSILLSIEGDALEAIKKELEQIMSDETISLVDFLAMDGIEAYPADDENDAKDFLVDRIWNVLFSNEKL